MYIYQAVPLYGMSQIQFPIIKLIDGCKEKCLVELNFNTEF